MLLHRLSLLAVFVVVACDPSSTPSSAAKKTDAKAAKGEQAADAKAADDNKDALQPGEVAGPLVAMQFDPAKAGDGTLPQDPTSEVGEDGTPISHVTKWGWTSAGDAFVYCYDDMDAGSCEVVDSLNKTILSAVVEDEEWISYEKSAGALGHGPTDWPHGDITITWAQDGRTLKMGARVGEADKPALIEFPQLDPDEADATYFPELVALSADRTLLAVVARYAVGEPIQGHHIKIVNTGDLVGDAYSAAGFAAMKAKKYDDAQGWFDKASAASTAWKHPYNLACARSLGGLEGAEEALKEAVERGGDPVRAKAKADDDLAKARGEGWFSAVVGD